MSTKTFIWIGVFVGTTVGGFIPSLWGADIFGLSSILWSTVGGLLGIYLGFKLSQSL